jgi:hypothetical protein
MPVQAADISLKLTGGSSNTNIAASLGGAASTTSISNSTPNLFDNITGADHAAGNVGPSEVDDYRVIAIKINSPLADASSSTLENGLLKVSASNLGDCQIQAAVAAAKNTVFTAGANKYTPPTDNVGGAVTFGSIPSGGLNLPNGLAAGDTVHVALKRTISSGSTAATNSITFQVVGDTI